MAISFNNSRPNKVVPITRNSKFFSEEDFKEAVEIISSKNRVFFFEEGMKSGGVAEKLGSILIENAFKGRYYVTAVEDKFVEQASVVELLNIYGLDKKSMVNKVLENR